MTKALFFKKKIHLVLWIFLIASLALASFGNTQVKDRPTVSDDQKWIPLFTASGVEMVGGDAIALQALRYRTVRINPLVSETGGVAVGDYLFISLFEDVLALGKIDHIETDVNGVLAIRARIQGMDGYLLLSSDKGRSLGRLVLPDRREFEISCVGGGTTHIIQEFKPGARIALEGSPPLIPPLAAVSESILLPKGKEPHAAGNTRIDCMIGYTPAARDYANARSGINNYISLAMQLAQLGMDNSLVGITMRLVYSVLIDYVESGNSSQDLSRLRNTNDGHMDQIHVLRNDYGADLVHLFTHVFDTGGIGYLLGSVGGRPDYAFSIGRIQQISYTTTTVHEMGHNMGSHHRKDQPVQPGPGLFSYSAGWRWVGNDSNKYCSIMSYRDDYGGTIPIEVEYFSNPTVRYKGTPTGDYVDGDNAWSLHVIKTVISNYLAESGKNALTITAGLGGTTNPSPGVHLYDEGTNASVTGLPDSNFRFDKWTGDASGNSSSIVVNMNEDKSIKANFIQIYKLEIISGDGGTTNPVPGTYQYDINEQVSVLAIPDDYHVFSNWSGDASGTDNPLVITMQANKSIKANFRPVLAPSNFIGSSSTNRNLFQIEYFNTLNWIANPANQGINIVNYRIYTINGTTTLLKEVSSSTFQYLHRQAGKDPQQYAIVGVLNDGREGFAAFITVQ